MQSELIRLCRSAIDMEWVKKHSLELNRLELSTTNKDFAESTLYVKRLMEEAGFSQIERYALPCDGVTTYDDCTMPLAWDRTGRSTLEMIEPERKLLADSDVQPITSAIWSPPTPEGGIVAELADIKSAVSDDWHELKGKIVLWDESPSAARKRKLIECGALGIVAYVDAVYDKVPDDVRWMNGAGLRGWYYTKDDPMMWVFSITPRNGRELAKRLAAGEKIVVKADMKTRVAPGEIYTVTGVIPGKSGRENALFAHMYEPFVSDDATGTVLSIAVGKALKDLAEAGKIPQLETGLRVVFSMERYGFSEYYFNPERAGKIVSSINMDSVCHKSLKEADVLPELRHSPASAPHFDTVILRNLLRADYPELPFEETPGNLSDDTFSADTTAGIPCCWFQTPPAPGCHHNTGSVFYDADWDIAEAVTSFVTAYHIKLNDTANKEELLKEITAGVYADAEKDYARLNAAQDSAEEKETISAFLAAYHTARITALNRQIPGAVDEAEIRSAVEEIRKRVFKNEAGSASLIPADSPMRKWIVTRAPGFSQLMSFIKVPFAERFRALTVPTMLMQALLDGKRTLHEAYIISNFFLKRAARENEVAALPETFEFLAKYGYYTIAKN